MNLKIRSSFLVFCFSFTAVNAAVIITPMVNSNFNGFSVSNSDLLQQPGVVVNTSNYSALGSFGQPNPVLIDGSSGGNTDEVSDWPNLIMEVSTESPQFSVTFNLGLSGAFSGYDITSIDTISGWIDIRASQKYEVEFSTIGDLGFSFLTSVNADANNQGLKTSITDSTGILASGVDALRFSFFALGSTQGIGEDGSFWREIDVNGIATTVPEPASIVLFGAELFGLIRARSSKKVC